MEILNRSKPPLPGREAAVLVSGLVIFFLVNCFTAERSPAVWCDEVMYADPAVNLYQGHGFTSGAWYAQPMTQFWAGNVPLYQFALFAWLKLFGFGIVNVRSFHYFLVGVAVFVAWLAILRLNLIPSLPHRLGFCLLMCLSSSSTFVFRSARPESLSILLVAMVLLAMSFQSARLRGMLLFLGGAFLVWSGLQMAAYVGIISSLVWMLGPRKFRSATFTIASGCAVGLFLLYVFFESHGVWGDFLVSIRRHTVLSNGQHAAFVRDYGTGFLDKFKKLPLIYVDYSFFPILALSLWILWRRWRLQGRHWNSPVAYGLTASFIVPLGLYLLGVFPLYYFWMAYLPLALAVCVELADPSLPRPSGWLIHLPAVLIAIACLVGLPRRLVVATQDWQGRGYRPVMEFAAPFVNGKKLILSEFAAYYAAKQYSADVVLPTGIQMLSESEKARMSVAILRDGDTASLARLFGGVWHDTGATLTPPIGSTVAGFRESLDSRQYHLRVFVRASPTP